MADGEWTMTMTTATTTATATAATMSAAASSSDGNGTAIGAVGAVGDAYARCRTAGSAAGRGSIAGWTPCPLCLRLRSHGHYGGDGNDGDGDDSGCAARVPSDDGIVAALALASASAPASSAPAKKRRRRSVKLFGRGRGLAAHLHAVHTPWNPGKAEVRRREAVRKRRENEEERRRRRRRLRRRSSLGEEEEEEEGQGGGGGGCRRRRRECDDDDDDERERRRGKKRRKTSHQDGGREHGPGVRPDPSGEPGKNETHHDASYEPTDDEVADWNRRVMEIVALVESEWEKKRARAKSSAPCVEDGEGKGTTNLEERGGAEEDATREGAEKGRDRNGNACPSYRESLHPFLAAAANGDLDALRTFAGGADVESSEPNAIGADETSGSRPPDDPEQRREEERARGLVSLRDRNGSTAEHWAAGGGHLDCLSYLLGLRDDAFSSSSSGGDDPPAISDGKTIRRRRDGKTSLHYAARNGRDDAIDLLLSRAGDGGSPDVPSGDGTTPLHLACYGGHPTTVRCLVESHGANPFVANEWGCGTAHWAAMSLGAEGEGRVVELCAYLRDRCGVDFAARQRQGHAPLHKAAARRNRAVVEWLADPKNFSEDERRSMGRPDAGGNRPSDIWLSVGGEREFGLWLRRECNW